MHGDSLIYLTIIHTIIFGMTRNIMSKQEKPIAPVKHSNSPSHQGKYVLIVCFGASSFVIVVAIFVNLACNCVTAGANIT